MPPTVKLSVSLVPLEIVVEDASPLDPLIVAALEDWVTWIECDPTPSAEVPLKELNPSDAPPVAKKSVGELVTTLPVEAAEPLEMSRFACASWLTVKLMLPFTAPGLAAALATAESELVAVARFQLFCMLSALAAFCSDWRSVLMPW